MQIPIYQVDAFADRLFTGNPAAVCPLAAWLPDAVMQAIAAENNLSETAFFVAEGAHFCLRWFTPAVEVPLCGHATLASAYVVFAHIDPARTSVRFETASGMLAVRRDGDLLVMDFPAMPPVACATPTALAEALGALPQRVSQTAGQYLAHFAMAERVRSLTPDMAALARLDRDGVIVTAPGMDGADFVSRYFAPKKGIAEDPVTGAAHCVLAPYWAKELGKTMLVGRQVSARGGTVRCRLLGERVELAGRAVPYMIGTIDI
ncbi:MAG: PhzF family phenazine biosynthesis protein [Alphaproteobacteria bacterium]|nr:PhzF family phenazine biosynthesis protein [Alphaproteobacteria bacterium]